MSCHFVLGGLGLRATRKHHLAAFLATQNKLLPQVRKFFANGGVLGEHFHAELDSEFRQLDGLRARFDAEYPQPATPSAVSPSSKSQRALSSVIDTADVTAFRANLDKAGKVHVEACAAPGAAAWLTANATF